MSDDIVTRLRERAIVLFSNGADGNAFIDEQAADEIERLRKTLSEWQWLADELYEYSDHKLNCTDGMLECVCGYEDPMGVYLRTKKLSGRG